MRDQIMSEFLKSLARPPVGSAVTAGGTVAALALAQAAALLARTGGGDGGSWLRRTGPVPALGVDELVSRAERITAAVRSGLTNQLVG
ncbi:hypothetical protein ABZU76_40285 [Amycolatopsis sp. NPDC005232]|uniref:hypothetical protein n=1 Tax=Amycolatopsis sp. NPDC005232 TaxID=3157027 RepID=UPI0033B92309